MLQSLRRSTVNNATTVTTVTIIIVTVVPAKQHHVCLLLVILTTQYIGAKVLRLTCTGKHVATIRPSCHCFRACSLFYIVVLCCTTQPDNEQDETDNALVPECKLIQQPHVVWPMRPWYLGVLQNAMGSACHER